MTVKCPICGELHEVDDRGDVKCRSSGVMLTLAEDSPTLPADAAPPDETTFMSNDSASAASADADASAPSIGRHSILHHLASQFATDNSGVLPIATDKYSAVGDIASGGMGRVVLARDHDLNRRVAMKTVLPHLSGSHSLVARFVREAQTVGQLEHPNIVPLYDIGLNEDGELYFTMKYVQGRTLEEIIKDLEAGLPEAHAQFSWQRRAAIIQQLCDAIEFAHRKGIVHRDLKPANIMLGAFGEVIVMDWGLAKHIGEDDDGAGASAVEVSELGNDETMAGALTGTPAYMSPEQVSEKPATTLSDIYAIGVIMYQLFGLRQPHTGDNVASLLQAIRNEPPPHLESLKHPLQGAVPIEIHHILNKVMAKNPVDRHQSPAALKAHIQLFLDGKFPVVCPHTAMKCVVSGFSRQIDNHPRSVAFVLLALLVTVVAVLSVSLF